MEPPLDPEVPLVKGGTMVFIRCGALQLKSYSEAGMPALHG